MSETWEARIWPRNTTTTAQRRALMLALLQNTGAGWGDYVLGALGLIGVLPPSLRPPEGDGRGYGRQQEDVFNFLTACLQALQQHTGNSENACASRVLEAALKATVDAIEMREGGAE